MTVKLKTSGDAEGSDYYITGNPNDTVSQSSINTQDSFAPGKWVLRPTMSAWGAPISVGPSMGSNSWWFSNNPVSDWSPYDCMGDDYVEFGAINPETGRGVFSMNLGSITS